MSWLNTVQLRELNMMKKMNQLNQPTKPVKFSSTYLDKMEENLIVNTVLKFYATLV